MKKKNDSAENKLYDEMKNHVTEMTHMVDAMNIIQYTQCEMIMKLKKDMATLAKKTEELSKENAQLRCMIEHDQGQIALKEAQEEEETKWFVEERLSRLKQNSFSFLFQEEEPKIRRKEKNAKVSWQLL